jgi:hypothetical protein
MHLSRMMVAALVAFALLPAAAQAAVDARLDGATLTITRAGVTAFQQAIPNVICDGCVEARAEVVDLDADAEPDVMVTSSTGGAYCCWLFGLYTYNAQTGHYAELVRNFGPAGAEIKDLDGDGVPELVSADVRFEERFGPHITSFLPPAIYHLEHGRLVDVTRAHPAQIRENARDAKGAFGEFKRGSHDGGGPVAAYVADQYLLGRPATGLKELDRQTKRGIVARSFRKRVLSLLHRYGYR